MRSRALATGYVREVFGPGKRIVAAAPRRVSSVGGLEQHLAAFDERLGRTVVGTPDL
jgi:hypothetical protein